MTQVNIFFWNPFTVNINIEITSVFKWQKNNILIEKLKPKIIEIDVSCKYTNDINQNDQTKCL